MNRILLLLDHLANRRLLADLLGQRYQVVEPADPSALLNHAFDLAIVDGPALNRSGEGLHARKEVEPVFLPVLLVASPREHRSLVPRIWQSIDEIIAAPVEKLELQARVEMLLRARRLSLEIQVQRDALQQRYDELAALGRELENKNALLEQLNQQKNQWLGMAAHDLRTPLGVISAYSDFLQETTDFLAGEQADFLARIKSSSQFMRSLVDDLLDLSQIEAGKLDLNLQWIDLAELIRANVDLNRLLAERKQIQLVLRCPDSLPALRLDPVKIEQVLNNLIGNAIKFSYPQTAVEISVDQCSDEEVTISVKDEGQGIPEDQIEALFEPFARTSTAGTAKEKTTGLGLAIVRRIVEGHGGRVRVESQVGKGSTFYVSLPLRPETSGDSRGGKEELAAAAAVREEVFDYQAALQRFGGDVAALKQHLEAFDNECPRLLDSIQGAIGRGESRSLARLAYRLGWLASQCSAAAIFDLSLQLEKIGRQGNLGPAGEVCGALEREIERLRSVLKTVD